MNDIKLRSLEITLEHFYNAHHKMDSILEKANTIYNYLAGNNENS